MRVVAGGHNHLGLRALDMGAPIANDPIGAIFAFWSSSISDDGIKLQTWCEGGSVERLIERGGGRQRVDSSHQAAGEKVSLQDISQSVEHPDLKADKV